MKNRIMSIALMLIAFLTVASTGFCRPDYAPKMPPTHLVYSEVNPSDSYSAMLAKLFARRVRDLSNGRIIIDIIEGSKIGDDRTVLEYIHKDVDIDIARVSVNYLQEYGAYKSGILSTPYIFTDIGHYDRFIRSDMRNEFLEELTELNTNFKGLFFVCEGFRNFFASKPIIEPSDIKGLRLRAPSNAYFDEMIKKLGAVSTKVDFTNLKEALKNNTLDGADQPVLNYLSNEFYKEAPYMILNNHSLAVGEVVINANTWNYLTEEQRSIILRASEYMERINKVTLREAEAKALATLKEKGANIIEVKDTGSWRNQCDEVTATTIKAFGNLYHKIQELK